MGIHTDKNKHKYSTGDKEFINQAKYVLEDPHSKKVYYVYSMLIGEI